MLSNFRNNSSFFIIKKGVFGKLFSFLIVFLFFAIVFCGCFRQAAPKRDLELVGIGELPEKHKDVVFLNLSTTFVGQLSRDVCLNYDFQNLECLSLRGQSNACAIVTTLPHGNAKKLEMLDLSESGCSVKLSNIYGIESLKKLYFSDAYELYHLEEGISQLKNLEYLNLDRNKLADLPNDFCGLITLKWLRLNNNQLVVLPQKMTNLKNLRSLYLRGNKFTQVPEQLKEMKSLEQLDLGDNQITELPKWLSELPNLKRIDVDGNPISDVPQEIIDNSPSLKHFVGYKTNIDVERKKEIIKQFDKRHIVVAF